MALRTDIMFGGTLMLLQGKILFFHIDTENSSYMSVSVYLRAMSICLPFPTLQNGLMLRGNAIMWRPAGAATTSTDAVTAPDPVQTSQINRENESDVER